MKNNIIISIAAVLLAALSTGCSVNEEGIMGSFPYIEVELDTKNLTKAASSDAIAINTNRTINVIVVADSQWLTAVIDGEQLVLTWTANELETTRSATIYLSTPNSIITKEIRVLQDASGELTFDGDLVLHSKGEIIANTYTKTTGDLIVGNVTSIVSKATDSSVRVELNGKVVTASPSDISDDELSLLTGQIHMIGGKGLAVVNTQATAFPVDMIAANDVEKVKFDYNAMAVLPSAETMQSLELKELSLKGNDLSDISALAGCATIESLDLTGNDVYDLEPLKSMSGLTEVVLTDLPLTQAQVEVFREQTGISVVADNVRQDESPLPVFGNIEVTEVSDTEVFVSVSIVNSTSGVGKTGFYIGTDRTLSSMTWHEASYSDGTLTLIYHPETLQNKVYYIRAYAENAAGGGYSRSAVFGSLYFYEDLYLRTDDDFQELVANKYSHIEGSLLVGDMSSSNEGIRLADGKYSLYFAPMTYPDLSPLYQIAYVRDGLYIGNIGMTNTGYISQISGVRTLWLKGNKISGLPAMESDATLTNLDVSMNSMKDFSFLERMPALEKLVLGSSDSPASETNDIGILTGLEKYTNLKQIDLSGLPLHEWQVSDLRTLMPETEITFRSGGRTPWIPTVVSAGVNRQEASAVLTGRVNSQGASAITEHGFYFGTDPDNLQKIQVGTSLEEGAVFSHEVTASEDETYYFYPYAVNQFGESRTSVDEFDLGSEDLSKYGTANCYIVSHPGVFVFNASVKGNSSEPIEGASYAEVIWETKNTDAAVTTGEIVTDVNFVSPNITFAVPDIFTPGNALIAVKDASGAVLWSWHIWVTEYEPDQTVQTYVSGAKMMDRNLGALDAGTTSTAFGFLYQWGRKDPLITSATGGDDFAVTAPADVRVFMQNVEGDKMAYSIQNPTHTIDNLINPEGTWSSDKTMYDPCPDGWRVPDGGPEGVWSGIYWEEAIEKGWSGNYDHWTIKEPYSTPAAVYPAPGYTGGDTYQLWFPGSALYCWSCTNIDENNAYAMHLFDRIERELRSNKDSEFTVRCQMMEADYTVETIDVVSEDKASVTVRGLVTLIRDCKITETGIVVSSSTDLPTVYNHEMMAQASSSAEGYFEATVTGIRSQVKYYIRAYAIGDKGVKYGKVVEYIVRSSGSGEGFTGDDFEW